MDFEENGGNLGESLLEEYHEIESCKDIEIPFFEFLYSQNRIVQ
jgi:hypothetical protein